MHYFQYKKGRLCCEEIAVDDLAREAGTPLFVYSQKTIVENVRRLEVAMAPVDASICYAVKANSSLGLLHLLNCMEVGFDVVSIGELRKVKSIGGDTKRCVFAGVGKTEAEITAALREGIFAFNVESIPELERINRIAKKLHKRAPVALRVNPNVNAGTHEKITTGTYENKFGIAFEEIESQYKKAKSKYKNLILRGVQIHIGSQLTRVDPYVEAVTKMIPLVENLRDKYGIEFFSIGGGIGIEYEQALQSGTQAGIDNQDFISPENFAKALIPLLQPLGVKILMEPGRFIVGNAGILVTRVEYVKQTSKKNFIIVDAGMNDLVRPAMYDAKHQIIPTQEKHGSKKIKADIVGPICESGDTFAHDLSISPVHEGDYLAILSAGAYSMSMASNYNARPLAAEVLVSGDKADYLRLREEIQTTWKYEGIPSWLFPDKDCDCCCQGTKTSSKKKDVEEEPCACKGHCAKKHKKK